MIYSALGNAGIAVFQTVFTDWDEHRVFVRVVCTLFHAESGENLVDEIALVPTKTDPQGIGSAITYGRRYLLMAMAGIAPEDDDGQAASGGKVDAPKNLSARAQPIAEHRNGVANRAPAQKNVAVAQPVAPVAVAVADGPGNPFTAPGEGAKAEAERDYAAIGSRLTGKAAEILAWAAKKESTSKGAAQKAQYEFLSGTLDKLTNNRHTHVLSVLCGRLVNGPHPCSKELAGALLDSILPEVPQLDDQNNKVKADGKIVYAPNPNFRQHTAEVLKVISQAE